MIQNILSILTALGVFLAGASPIILSELKNLRRARMKKALTNASSNQSGQGPKSVDWRKRAEIFRLFTGVAGYGLGIATLMWLVWSKAPLTTGDAATIMLCLLFCLPTLLEPLRKD